MKHLPRKRYRGSSGFTLVELVIVITIIAVLAGSGIYLVVGFVDDAKYQRVDSDLKALDLALKSYERKQLLQATNAGPGAVSIVRKTNDRSAAGTLACLSR